MNRRDLVDRIAESAALTKVQAAKALDACIEGIQSSLVEGNRVALMGFGTFALSERKSRKVRNPRSGTDMLIPARLVPRFTPGLDLRAALEARHDQQTNTLHTRAS